ncbi:ABC transporter ATP-binding protein [Arthrobacter yangruifuii]|uniref:ABC transporter ATP-binding protein n=1 Tax=Arthrobacter yangruifuii TaxID=2606616 RepID=UPI0011B4458C|nr:ABC transporter ATP-binding protein [Arthrobacter yangruifuii]
MGKQLLEAFDVVKSFQGQGSAPITPVLRGISLQIRPGELVAIVGPSGSGKSTLLYCLAGLETCTSGTVNLLGGPINGMSHSQLAALRQRSVGFVFQTYNLIPSLSARDNVALPARLAGDKEALSRVDGALAAVGLTDRGKHAPAQLSGGQQQRIAIARVLVMAPRIVFADEPTGALDSQTGAAVLDLLRGIAAGERSVVLVTHDLEAAACADRVLVLRDGIIHEELHHPAPREILESVERARLESGSTEPRP